jgi:3-oxoacyl-(acyl-carrier-protein) synthase
MKRCYINGIGNVSVQNSSDNANFFDGFTEEKTNVILVHKPNYKEYIKPNLIRRMATGVRMGVVASAIALGEAGVENPEAIITGTGMGCLIDSKNFLKKMVDNNEQFLTPTSFIQSTHNTVGGQIALGLACKSYNVTYVHSATSFESSLFDSLMMLEDNVHNILVGGVDEISDYTVDLYKLIAHVKNEETLSEGILNSKSKGAVFGEGAQFFVLDSQKNKNTYAVLKDVKTYNRLDQTDVTNKLIRFLDRNDLKLNDIDVVILGINGDVDYDHYYSNLQDTIFKNTPQLYYKHLSGEYNTATAFGFWTACQIIKEQKIPKILKLNDRVNSAIKNILLYNQYRGEYHSFTLLGQC